jgi:hypothetical protein
MTFSNGMEMMPTIRADRRIEGVDPGRTSVRPPGRDRGA